MRIHRFYLLVAAETGGAEVPEAQDRVSCQVQSRRWGAMALEEEQGQGQGQGGRGQGQGQGEEGAEGEEGEERNGGQGEGEGEGEGGVSGGAGPGGRCGGERAKRAEAWEAVTPLAAMPSRSSWN